MKINVDQLLDEFVGRWTRGEPIAVDEMLVRAGPYADELADLIDAFLQRAPRHEPTPAALAYVRSLDQPSLLRARQAHKLKLDDISSLIVERLGLPATSRAKVRRYYQDLELGRLDPNLVAAKLWHVLTGLLGADARRLAETPPRAHPAPAMFRANLGSVRGKQASHLEWPLNAESFELRREKPVASERPEPDEVDRLFGLGLPG